MAGRRSRYDEGGLLFYLSLLLGREGIEALSTSPETWAVCRVTMETCPLARIHGTAVETVQTPGGLHVPRPDLRV